MRVGLVSAYDLSVPGGVQRQVAELAACLEELGVATAVLAPGPGVDLAEVGGRVGVRSDSAGRAVPVRGNGSVARVGPPVGGARRVRDWVARHRLDVLHLHEPFAPGLPQAVLRVAGGGGPPVVATVHVTAGAGAAAALRVAGPVLRRRLARAAAVTAVGATAAATARVVLGRHADVAIIGNGVRQGLPARPRPPGPPTAVAVGRLDEPRKGIDVLLAAWPRVRVAVPDARLLLVGPGTPRGGAAGTTPGVVVLGRVSEDARVAALDSAHVAVAPHRGGESFGLVVAEAMARGLPVVASDLPAFAALLTDGTGRRGGVLVPAGCAEPLARAVAGLLVDPAERAARSRDASALVARHSWPRVSEAYRQVYRASTRARG